MADKETLIATLAEEFLKEKDLFLIEIILKHGANGTKVLVIVDGDSGVDVEQCAKLSRYLGNQLEEKEIFDDKYTLEVSSPGLEHPLKLHRQYIKNITRDVKVTTLEGAIIKGKLKEVHQDDIVVGVKEKSKGKKMEKDLRILFSDISKTHVLVSFS